MWKKTFCRYFLQAFRTTDILKEHTKDDFKINDKERTRMPTYDEYVRFKSYLRKIMSPFIIDAVLNPN